MQDLVYLNIADSVGLMSTCTRTRIGCIIVKENRIISYGFNGGDNCTYESCPRTQLKSDNSENEVYCRGTHAEMRALINSINFNGGVLYCTMKPCGICARMIATAGIRRVVYHDEYRDSVNDLIFKENNIDVLQIKRTILPEEIIAKLVLMDQQQQEYVYSHLGELLKQVKYDYE